MCVCARARACVCMCVPAHARARMLTCVCVSPCVRPFVSLCDYDEAVITHLFGDKTKTKQNKKQKKQQQKPPAINTVVPADSQHCVLHGTVVITQHDDDRIAFNQT